MLANLTNNVAARCVLLMQLCNVVLHLPLVSVLLLPSVAMYKQRAMLPMEVLMCVGRQQPLVVLLYVARQPQLPAAPPRDPLQQRPPVPLLLIE